MIPSNSNTLLSLYALIEQRLKEFFNPTYLQLIDDSHEHIGHAGSVGGGRHFSLTMQAVAFTDLSAVKKHQLVYKALSNYLDNQYAVDNPNIGYIHALKLKLNS